MPRRADLIAALGVLIFAAGFGALLGGSALLYLAGAPPLDIRGRAEPALIGASVAGDWTASGADAGGHRYVLADQITVKTVGRLKPVWRYSTGDLAARGHRMGATAARTTPRLLGDRLVFCTAFNEIVAVDPATGRQIWRYDPKLPADLRTGHPMSCRGVASWTAPQTAGACARRVFSGTNDGRLVAVDLETGLPCRGFGRSGAVQVFADDTLAWPGEAQITAPPLVTGDVVIVGSTIADNIRRDAPRGTIRAYDAKTGALRWSFDPIPRVAGAAGWDGDGAPIEGAANVVATMSADVQRGLVFAVTTAPSPDHFGGLRPGDNRHANALVALDAQSGRLVWAQQIIRHDVWGYDLTSQPGLYAITTLDGPKDVVTVLSPTGHLFVFDRDDGRPLPRLDEVPVPRRAVPGERLAARQRLPPTAPLVPHAIAPGDGFGLTWIDRQGCGAQLERLWAGGPFAAPSLQGTVQYPAPDGGGLWGGTAYDPARNLVVMNFTSVASAVRLVPRDGPGLEELAGGAEAPQAGTPFAVLRRPLVSALGLPCAPPPWGVLAAVDLASGRIVWRRTLGETGLPGGALSLPFGAPNAGGAVVTSGGLIFIAATTDGRFRAFDVETGAQVWRADLPAGGQATPISYMHEGRQYVAIFAGGDAALGTPKGDVLIAYAVE